MIRFRLDELLKERGWSAYRLAKETGLHNSVIGKYRHNQALEARVDVLNRLCAALNCGIADLIEYVPDKKARKR